MTSRSRLGFRDAPSLMESPDGRANVSAATRRGQQRLVTCLFAVLQSHCECLPGYQHLLDGSCSLRDSCRPDSCHKNANCTNVGPERVE